MTWVLSDIHGCYRQYQQLLDTVSPGAQDSLYILGDAADRGPDSMRVLVDILHRPRTFYIPGNHDYFLRRLGPRYALSESEGGAGKTPFDAALYAVWMHDGGRETLRQFRALSLEMRLQVLHALHTAPAFAEVRAGGISWVLVHKPVAGFEKKPSWNQWGLRDYLRRAVPYERPYFADGRRIVSGHRWTARLRDDHASRFYTGNGHIVIDCGCVFGGSLGALCLDTGQAVYTAYTL